MSDVKQIREFDGVNVCAKNFHINYIIMIIFKGEILFELFSFGESNNEVFTIVQFFFCVGELRYFRIHRDRCIYIHYWAYFW